MSSDTISKSQDVFTMTHNLLYVYEIVQEYRFWNRKGIISKAGKVYDQAKWGFLDFDMDRKGFETDVKSGSMVAFSNLSMVVNGMLGNTFRRFQIHRVCLDGE